MGDLIQIFACPGRGAVSSPTAAWCQHVRLSPESTNRGSLIVADVEVAKAPPEPAAGSRWRGRLLNAARLIVVLVVAGCIAIATIRLWPDVRETFGGLSWTVLLASTAFAALSIGASMVGWREILADLGHRISLRDAAPINLVGQLGKYVPGTVWAFVLQMQLARRVGVPRSRGFLASIIGALLGVAAGSLVGSLGLPSLATMEGDQAGTGRIIFYLTLALLPVALICATPLALSRLVGLALRLTKRDPLTTPLSWRGVLTALGWSGLGYAFAGMHLWLLVTTVAGSGVKVLVVSTAAFALAMVAGTFAFVVPSGIGARELVITAVLAGVGVSAGQALALALVSRLLMTVADVATAGAAAAVALRRVRGAEPESAPEPEI